jgi:hypothetical protein
MADAGDAEFNFPAQQLDLMDDNVQRILSKCDSRPREEIVDEICSEFDVESLLEQREKGFVLAKQKLQNDSRAITGDETSLDIKCVRRTGKSAKKNIAKEIVDLFEYVVGYSEDFPRYLITKDSRLVSVSNELCSDKDLEPMKINDKMKLIELSNIVNELAGKMNSVVEENRKMGMKIKGLEKEIDGLKSREVGLCNPTATTDTAATNTAAADRAAGTTSGSASGSTSGSALPTDVLKEDATMTTEVESNREEMQATKKIEGGNVTNVTKVGDISDSSEDSDDSSELQCAQRSPKSSSESSPEIPNIPNSPKSQRNQRNPKSVQYNVWDQNGVDWTTVISKNNSKRGQHEGHTSETKRSNTTRDDTRLYVRLPPSQNDTPQMKGKPTDGQSVKNRKDSYKPRDQLTGSSRNNKRPLRGIKQEKSTALYLKSIQVTNESNEDVGKIVKDYASSRGIRIMGYHVIRYKSCDDAVGCKIFVPEAQLSMALDPDMWPSDITCRRWERPDIWKEKLRKEQKGQWEDRMRDEEHWHRQHMYEGDEYYDRPH